MIIDVHHPHPGKHELSFSTEIRGVTKADDPILDLPQRILSEKHVIVVEFADLRILMENRSFEFYSGPLDSIFKTYNFNDAENIVFCIFHCGNCTLQKLMDCLEKIFDEIPEDRNPNMLLCDFVDSALGDEVNVAIFVSRSKYN